MDVRFRRSALTLVVITVMRRWDVQITVRGLQDVEARHSHCRFHTEFCIGPKHVSTDLMPQSSPSSQATQSGLALPLTCLVALLAIAAPQFLRTPLTNDTALYDLQSRMLKDGAVLYRDVLEPNLPGVVCRPET